MFATQLVNLLCNAVVCVLSKYTIVYEHDGVDKMRVDSTWQHVHMHAGSGSEVDLLVHNKSR